MNMLCSFNLDRLSRDATKKFDNKKVYYFLYKRRSCSNRKKNINNILRKNMYVIILKK